MCVIFDWWGWAVNQEPLVVGFDPIVLGNQTMANLHVTIPLYLINVIKRSNHEVWAAKFSNW